MCVWKAPGKKVQGKAFPTFIFSSSDAVARFSSISGTIRVKAPPCVHCVSFFYCQQKNKVSGRDGKCVKSCTRPVPKKNKRSARRSSNYAKSLSTTPTPPRKLSHAKISTRNFSPLKCRESEPSIWGKEEKEGKKSSDNNKKKNVDGADFSQISMRFTAFG